MSRLYIAEQLQIIATDILWLLDRNLPAHAPEYFQQQYRSLLIDRGLANSNGRVYQDRLQTDFQSFYDRDVLTLLDSTVAKNCNFNWLVSITRKHHKSFHPIGHLLFIRFLNDTLVSHWEKRSQSSSEPTEPPIAN